MNGIAVKPLTVGFHETQFLSKLNQENQLGFWFQLSNKQRQQAGSPWGPANPQALNRYSYVLNNPLRYTDPSGHSPWPEGSPFDTLYDLYWGIKDAWIDFARELQTVLASVTPFSSFNTAKDGGRHAGTYNNYVNKNTTEVQKALRGYEKQVQEHADKMLNPGKYIDNWSSLDPREQQGLLNKWAKDLARNQELADIMKGILYERGVYP
jgi:hypothetical protein